MSRRSTILYPFVVIAALPKGHAFGSKKRETIRREYCQTIQQAQIEKRAIESTGATAIIKDRRQK